MALPLAYGSSRDYWRAQQGILAPQNQQAYQNQMGQYQPHLSQTNQAAPLGSERYRQASMGYLSHLQQMQAYLPREAVSVKRSNKVVGDCGFGGADSRPRSRRLAKTPTTASSPPPQS